MNSSLAAALELKKGEQIEWIVRDRQTFEIRRHEAVAPRKARDE